MGTVVDLRGMRFGRLRVPASAEPEIRNRHAYWPCVCQCGRQVVVRGSKLLCGRIVSCGCWRDDVLHKRIARRAIRTREQGRQTPSPRNREILAARKAGLTLCAIAARHGITKQRVAEILKRYY